MTVYAVWSGINSNLLAIFSTKAKAEQMIDGIVERAKLLERKIRRVDFYVTEENVIE